MSSTSDSVTLTALSPIPSKPCLLVSFPTCKILFDCAVDFSPMNFYSPCSMIPKIGMDYTDYVPNENSNDGPTNQKRSRFNSEPPSEKKMDVDDLKPNLYKPGVRPSVSIDAVPEVNFILNSNIDLTVIDAIFISNWESLKGLPFLTENKGLSCPIYATEPVISLGSLIIEDLLHFFERTDRNVDDKEWVDSEAWDAYVGEDPRKSVPSQWRGFYTEESLRKAISKMTRISPNQPVPVGNGIQVRLYQSGFEIGSCNWLIEVQEKKIGVWTATSKQQKYVHEPVFKNFAKLDSLVLTNLREIDADPNLMIADMCATAVDTLCAGGNVLFPMQPIGLIYDIIESLIGRMDQVSPNKNFPVYVFSPVSKKGLAFTNIAGEWFCEEKREKLFTPKAPFRIHEFIERKRVFMYESIHSSFSTEYRVPCVAFVGHPSLRIGDAVYFMELWGNNSKNAVILSNPDFDFDFTWSPFLSSRIRAFWFPVDMRLSPSEVNNILITEVDAKKLIVPEDYVNSNSGVLKHENIVTFEPSLPLKITEVDDRIDINCFSDEIANVVRKGEGTMVQGFMNYVGKEIQILKQIRTRMLPRIRLQHVLIFAFLAVCAYYVNAQALNDPITQYIEGRLGNRRIFWCPSGYGYLAYCPQPTDWDNYNWCCTWPYMGSWKPSCCPFAIPTGAVVAIIIASIILLAVLIGLSCWCCYCCPLYKQLYEYEEDDIPPGGR